MRTEEQLRERIGRLLAEGDTIRKQIARMVLSDHPDERIQLRDMLAGAERVDATIRALDWALGGRA
jgi:hypothetical protein